MKPELLLSLKGYRKKDLASDLMSGLLVAIIALPLSIALGIQSNSTLQAGLITAIVAGFFISALGGSRFQIGGPTAAFVVILFGYLADPEIGVLGLQIATIAAGLILILLGVFKVGSAIRFVPFPIVVGFTTGIGITLMAGQLKDFFGMQFSGTAGDFIGKLSLFFGNFGTANWYALGVGIAALGIIVFLPKIFRKVPSAFAAVVLATLLTLLLNSFAGAQIPTIGSLYGDVKASFSFIDFTAFGNVKLVKLILPAFVIAFLSAIESLLSATVADGMAGTKHNSNQELIGQGVANVFSPVFGGLPATGAIARTAANIDSGAKTSLSGIFHALFLLIMYLVLMPVVKYVPMTALAAVLLSVAFRMSKFSLFGRLTSLTVRDSVILFASCLLTVFFDLTYGVAGGFALALIVNIHSMIRKLTVRPAELSELENSEKYLSESKKYALVAEGTVYFLNVDKLLKKISEAAAHCDELILDVSKIERIDMTAVERLAKKAKELSKQGKRLVLHRPNARVAQRYQKSFAHIIKVW